MKRLKFATALFLLQVFWIPSAALAQTGTAQTAADVYSAIRKEEASNSQISKTLYVLTDVYGPRLTGSPNLKAAGEWAMKQMKDWGFDKTAMEPWNFGYPGWAVERASGFITSPVQDSLVFEVLAWTPSTKGAVSGQGFNMLLPERPTQAELDAYFASVKGQIAGKIVFVGKPAVVAVNFEGVPKRLSDDQLKKRFDPNAPAQARPSDQHPAQTPKAGALTGGQVNEQLDKFLLDNGVLVRVNDAGREQGQIRAFGNRTFDVTKVVPTVVMRNEDYGRIVRLLNDKRTVNLEFDIRTKTYPEGATSYNTIGEITGTDKKDEVVMLGGHLDSWHSATGTTDNAIGCAVMLEAARILKAIGVKPRRTIRVALWSGEEQGLLGSQAYVKQHFGSAETPTADYSKLVAYFNIDSGTGRARGFGVFGPAETAAPLREVATAFADLGVAGAINMNSRALGGSDYTSFNKAGLPGITVMQDPIEYFTTTWHTNLDTYERVVDEDVKNSAMVIAAAVYQLAMRDEPLPRFKAGELPPLPTRD